MCKIKKEIPAHMIGSRKAVEVEWVALSRCRTNHVGHEGHLTVVFAPGCSASWFGTLLIHPFLFGGLWERHQQTVNDEHPITRKGVVSTAHTVIRGLQLGFRD